MRRSELKIGRTEMSRVSATNHTYPELVKIIAVDLSKPCEMVVDREEKSVPARRLI